MSADEAPGDGAPRWDSTAHGPVRGPVHATYAAPPGSNRAIPLLDLITRQSLDEDYQHVAERRQDGPQPTGRARVGLTVVVVVIFGLLVTVAAVQTSRNASIDSASKDQLISRINTRRAAVASLQQQIATVRASNAGAGTTYAALGRRLNTVTGSQATLLAGTGWGEVSGDGVRVRLDDAPGAGTDGQVRDSDLAGLVNGLWQAGATAVSINGQRVTVLSALRNSGTVVRINDFSLSPPYTVLALGDTGTLQAKFAESTSGMRLRNLTRQYGMPFTMHNVQGLRLPAAPSSMLAVRYAKAETRTEKEMP